MKILVVEDSHSMRAYLTTMIESDDEADILDIVEASSGFEALKLLPHHAFDAILTDINMPDINGLELVSFVKKNPQHRDIPLFIVTTEGRDADRKRGIALGADEYLVKPFEPDELRKLVARYLKPNTVRETAAV